MNEGSDLPTNEDEPINPSTSDQPTEASAAEIEKASRDGRFKKGVSGNPSGRPRKRDVPSTESHDVVGTFKRVFAARVKANVGGKTEYIDGMEAGFLHLRAKVSNGDLKAMSLVIDLCRHFHLDKSSGTEQLKGLFDALRAGPVKTPKAKEDPADSSEDTNPAGKPKEDES